MQGFTYQRRSFLPNSQPAPGMQRPGPAYGQQAPQGNLQDYWNQGLSAGGSSAPTGPRFLGGVYDGRGAAPVAMPPTNQPVYGNQAPTGGSPPNPLSMVALNQTALDSGAPGVDDAEAYYQKRNRLAYGSGGYAGAPAYQRRLYPGVTLPDGQQIAPY